MTAWWMDLLNLCLYGLHRLTALGWLQVGAVLILGITGGMGILRAGRFVLREAAYRIRVRQEISRRTVPFASMGRRTLVLDHPHAFAFTLGLFFPRVIISTGMLRALSAAELAAVLEHERLHCLRRHPLRAFLAETMRQTLFFLPLLSDAVRFLHIKREILADRAAVRSAGRTALAGALMKSISWDRIPPAFVSVASFGRLHPRVEALIHARTPVMNFFPNRLAVSAAALVAVLLLAIFSSLPASATGRNASAGLCRANEQPAISSPGIDFISLEP